MGPYEEGAEQAMPMNTVSHNETLTAKAAKPSELERAFMALDKQLALIQMLDGRLSPVMHRNPPSDKEASRDRGPHISTVGDIIQENNRRLSDIIEQLAL